MRFLLSALLLLPLYSFAATVNYSCDYTSYSDQKGNHKAKDKFVLNFIVDTGSGKSYLLGNNGSAEIKSFIYEDRAIFIEVTATGNIISTAVDSNLNSVHSRNSVIIGELVPSQHYGKCTIK